MRRSRQSSNVTRLMRQLRRRRTQVTFGLMVLLPVIVWVAFELAAGGPPAGSLNLVDLARTSGPNFAVFTLFVSASFLLVVVVALFFGDTVAAEASWSSLRYLLTAPIPRARLLRQKAAQHLFDPQTGQMRSRTFRS